MKKHIYPCIWCNNNAKEMANFYCKVFPHTKIISENSVVVIIEIDGHPLMLLNGGDHFRPNPSVSIMYLTTSEIEVETIWNQLAEKGKVLMPIDEYPFSPKYGMVEDQYGVSWQLYTGKAEHIVQKIVPTLMFTGANNGKAKEAATLYTSLFPNSALRGMLEYTGNEGEIKGNVQHGEFMIDNYLLMIMDSSYDHKFNFTEGVSLVALTNGQEETDKYWNALTADGGKESMCSWLKDKYGLSWQIVPKFLIEIVTGSDKQKAKKAMDAVMKMKKIIVSEIEAALQ